MKLFAIVFLAGLFGAQAFAADTVIAEQPVVVAQETPGHTWTGFYVGAQLGYGWGDSTLTVNDDPLLADVFLDFDPRGLLGGIHVGYDKQMQSGVVVGIEGDLSYANLNGDGAFNLVPEITGESDLNWGGSVRGRVGYALERFLPYITGGVAFGDYEHHLFDALTGDESHKSHTYVGWTVGAGVEYAFIENWTTRVEYRYTDFGKESFDVPGNADSYNVGLKTHDVRIGMTYRF
jgi:outer membrane immunogenic protein